VPVHATSSNVDSIKPVSMANASTTHKTHVSQSNAQQETSARTANVFLKLCLAKCFAALGTFARMDNVCLINAPYSDARLDFLVRTENAFPSTNA
jgi:hypothetical protein